MRYFKVLLFSVLMASVALADAGSFGTVTNPFEKPNEPCPRTFFLWSSGNFITVALERDANGDPTGARFDTVQTSANTGGTSINGSGFSNADGYVYAYSGNNFFRYDADNNCELLRTNSGATAFTGVPVGTQFFVADLALDGTKWFFLKRSGPPTLVWLNLDPTQADPLDIIDPAAQTIALTRPNGTQAANLNTPGDFAMNPLDGKLYGVERNGRIFRIDPATGVTETTGTGVFDVSNYNNQAFGGTWFDTDGVLYAVHNQNGNGNPGEYQAVRINQTNFTATNASDRLFNVVAPGSGSNDGAGCFGSVLGVGKDMGRSDLSDYTVPIELDIYFTVENLATSAAITNLTMPEDLSAVFGTHGTDWTFTSITPVAASGNTINIWDTTFNGHAQTELLTTGSQLAAGQIAQAKVTIQILTLNNLDADQEFKNSVVATGEIGNSGYKLKDQSHDPTPGEAPAGVYPDPDPVNENDPPSTPGDGNPVENDVSTIGISSLPVSLASLEAQNSGNNLVVRWSTASETNNLGFHIYGKGQDRKMVRLGDMIPSEVVNSTSPQSYSAIVETPSQLRRVFIATVDTQGFEEVYGPFKLGQRYGAQANEKKIEWARVKKFLQRKGYTYKNGKLSKLGATWRQFRKARRLENLANTLFGKKNQAAVPYVKIKSDKPGFAFVSYEELRDFGLDLKGVRKQKISVAFKGEPVARHVYGSKKFGPGSGIAFYIAPQQAGETTYTRESVYTIQKNKALVKKATQSDAEVNGALEDSYAVRTVLEQNSKFVPSSPVGSPWLWDSLFAFRSPLSRSYTFELSPDRLPYESVMLKADFVGGSDFPGTTPDHHVQLSVNGQVVGDAMADGKVGFSIAAQVSPDLLQDSNELVVTLPHDLGFLLDLVYLDKFTFDVPQELVAKQGRLEFQANGQAFSVKNLQERPLVLAESSGELTVVEPRELLGNWAFNGIPGAANYFVGETKRGETSLTLDSGRLADTHLDQPADLLVIASPVFADDPKLADFVSRKNAELRTKIVNLDDIYEAHGYGNKTPEAIRTFLQRAAKNFPYQHVLLVGADSYDYHNYANSDSVSFVPTMYGETRGENFFTPSDGLLVDLDGDRVPDKAIGRWAVRDEQELAFIIDKTLQYNQTQRQLDTAVLLAEGSESRSYSRALDQLASFLKSPEPWLGVTKIYMDDLAEEFPGLPSEEQAETARQRLNQALNQGQKLTIFEGHGSTTRWSYDQLLTPESAAELRNEGKPTVFLPLACYTTNHNSPSSETLAHQLMHSGLQGGALITGAATLSNASENLEMAQRILQGSLSGGLTIGEAVLAAKQEMSRLGYSDVVVNWELLGDPSLRLER